MAVKVRPVSVLPALLPFAIALSIVIVSFLPFGTIDDLLTLGPQLVVCVIFFWAVHAPGRMPPLALFSLGLVIDLFSAGPLGFWGLVYLIVYGLILPLRGWLAQTNRLTLWCGFTAAAAVSAFIAWGLGSVYFATLVPVLPLAVAACVSIAVYPLLSWLFERTGSFESRKGR